MKLKCHANVLQWLHIRSDGLSGLDTLLVQCQWGVVPPRAWLQTADVTDSSDPVDLPELIPVGKSWETWLVKRISQDILSGSQDHSQY